MKERVSGIWRRFGQLAAALGPGLFLIGYNIGTGSVTTMASAGSRYGMALFWLLIFSCVFTWVMLIAYGRFTVVTGLTAIRAFRLHLPFGRGIALYAVFSLTLGAGAGVAGVMGIVADLIREWTGVLFGGNGFPPVWTALVVLTGCYVLLWTGRYSHFEKFLSSMVILMGVSFVLSFFLVVPRPSEVLLGLLPGIPRERNSFLIMSAMAGTTSGAMLFVMRSLVVAEKGWKVDELPKANRDALVSVLLMLVLSGAIMGCAAGTLYRLGIPVEKAVDMVRTLEPIAGPFAITVFVIGIIGAGVSSIFPQAPVLPWLICDYRGARMDTRSSWFRFLAGLGFLTGMNVPLFGGSPVWIMIGVTAFQTPMMPVAALAILSLINNRQLMGQHRAGWALNLGIMATLVFSMFAAFFGIKGLMDRLL